MSQPRMPGRNFLFVPGPTNVPDGQPKSSIGAFGLYLLPESDIFQ
jgi:hypothetical protein